MAYEKKVPYLSTPEKLALAEELWGKVEEVLLPVTNEEIAFAEERLKIYESNPSEGASRYELKKYFARKYGF